MVLEQRQLDLAKPLDHPLSMRDHFSSMHKVFSAYVEHGVL